MKITAIFCGRKRGISECIAREALRGASETGAQTQLINLMNLDIKPCINCGSCVQVLGDDTYTGKCPFSRDDIGWLDERILESDGLLFVAPMYEKAVPATYKMMCDRMGPSHDVTFQKYAYDRRIARGEDPHIDSRWFISRPVSFIGHGGSEWSHLSYPTMAVPAISLGLTIVDRLQFDWDTDLIFRSKDMERIRRSGSHVAQMAQTAPEQRFYMGEEGFCPICHNDVMVLSKDSTQVCCTVCGIKGNLSIADGKFKISYAPEEIRKSHVLESGRQIHLQDLQGSDEVEEQYSPQQWRERIRSLCEGEEVLRP